MGPAFYGLLGGFLVNIMPGAKRKQGLETPKCRAASPTDCLYHQLRDTLHRVHWTPYLLLDRYGLYCRGLHHFCGDGQSAGFIFCGSCHNYYHCFTESGIRWRNWRRKVRYFDYHSIYKVSYEQTRKNGWVKIRSTQLPKHIKLGLIRIS